MKRLILLPALLFTGLASAQDPYKKSGASPSAPPADAPPVITVREETLSLPLKESPAFLRDFPTDLARYTELLRRVEKGDAMLERTILLRAKSGTRAASESTEQVRYEVETEPGKPTKIECQTVGDTLEFEPILSADGQTVDLNCVTRATRLTGWLDKPNSKIRQPIFQTRSATTVQTLRVGERTLLATLNPPSSSVLPNQPREERLHLDFVTISVGAEGAEAKAIPSRPEMLSKSLIIPQLEFRDATIEECVAFLRSKAKDLDPEKLGVNLVIHAPPSTAATKISLSLKNVPLGEALKYVSNLAGLTMKTDTTAIVLAP